MSLQTKQETDRQTSADEEDEEEEEEEEHTKPKAAKSKFPARYMEPGLWRIHKAIYRVSTCYNKMLATA